MKNKGIEMNQPATETTETPTTLTVIDPTQDEHRRDRRGANADGLGGAQNLLAHHVRLVARGLSDRALRLRVAGRLG